MFSSLVPPITLDSSTLPRDSCTEQLIRRGSIKNIMGAGPLELPDFFQTCTVVIVCLYVFPVLHNWWPFLLFQCGQTWTFRQPTKLYQWQFLETLDTNDTLDLCALSCSSSLLQGFYYTLVWPGGKITPSVSRVFGVGKLSGAIRKAWCWNRKWEIQNGFFQIGCTCILAYIQDVQENSNG